MPTTLTPLCFRQPAGRRAVAAAAASPRLGPGSIPPPEPRRRRPRLVGVRREASVRAGEQPRRVLLVDDDPALRMLYRFNLEASGVEVVEAEDGEAALERLGHDLPDVVLLDVMMPGIDGWAVAERLAADERLRGVPLIFITAHASDEARARGLRLGAAGYLTKPFNPVLLADEIERILEREREGEQGAR